MPIALSTTPWLKRGKSPSKSTSSNTCRAATYQSRFRSLVEAQLEMLEHNSDWDVLKELEEEIEEVKEEVS